MDTLTQALNGLEKDPQRRAEYNEWLQKFQRSPEAWEVCSQVLQSDTPRGLRIFCAQTLRNKTAHDLHQLDDKLVLKQNIMQLLTYNSSLQVVCVQLCIALANLAMQAEQWADPLTEMVEALSNSVLLPCLLEFLRVLPEDFGVFGRAKKMERARVIVGENAPRVLNLLLEKAAHLENPALFFETLLPWIPEVPVGDIAKSPILDWIFKALTSDETVAPASDCLCAIIHETREVREPTIQQVIEVLLPRILSLREAKAHYSDTELHRNMTYIFSRAAEDWHMLIIENEPFRGLLDAVVDCVDVEGADYDVLEYTFSFLDGFELAVNTPKWQYTAPQFVSSFERLQAAFIPYLEYRDFDSLQEEDDFKTFRYDIGDMLKVCCFFLGPDRCIGQSCDALEQGPNWQRTEALLFAIRSVARAVSQESTIVSRVFSLIPRLPSSNPKVVHAALMILSRYSDWAALHTDYIEFELQYLTEHVKSDNYEVRRAAAHALHFFLTDCAKQLVKYVEQLVQFYLGLELDIESQLKVAEGVGAVVELLDSASAAQALNAVFEAVLRNPTATTVEGLSGFATSVRTSGQADDTSALTAVAKHYHPAFMALVPSMPVPVLRYYIAAVQNCSTALRDLLPTLIQACAQVPMHAVLPSLYGALAQTFNDHQESMASYEVIDALSTFFTSETKRILASPEIDDELALSSFHFWCDLLSFYTQRFVFSDEFDSVVALATLSLKKGETNTLLGVAHFFEDLRRALPTGANPAAEATIGRVSAIIKAHGADIFLYVFIGFQYNFEENYFPRACDIIDFCCVVGQPECMMWIQSAYNALPTDAVASQNTAESLQGIIGLLSQGRAAGVGHLMETYAHGYKQSMER